MANTIITTNMSLPVPIVTTDPGPDYALNVNTCFAILDAHTHTNGNGVPITPAAMNINANLSFQGFSPTNVLSVIFSSQSLALSGLNFLSFVGGDLYVNDGSGNQIQMTSAGGIAGTPGNIANLVSPASATYVSGSKTFVWQSGSSKAAAMDNGAITIRQTDTASVRGITLSSPNALGADYSLVFPAALPGSSNEYLTSDTSGNLSFSSADSVASQMTSVGADSIASVMDATGANAIGATRVRVTGTTETNGNIAISASTGAQSGGSGAAWTTVCSCTLTKNASPVIVMIGSDGTTDSYLGCSNLAAPLARTQFRIRTSGGTLIAQTELEIATITSNPEFFLQTPPGLAGVHVQGAATYTYQLQAQGVTVNDTWAVHNCVLIAYAP